MNVDILRQEKDEIELKMDNVTVAEVLRVYLNKQSVKFAAWRREHPSKPIIFRIQASSGTVKKAVSDAVKEVKKDTDAIIKLLK